MKNDKKKKKIIPLASFEPKMSVIMITTIRTIKENFGNDDDIIQLQQQEDQMSERGSEEKEGAPEEKKEKNIFFLFPDFLCFFIS